MDRNKRILIIDNDREFTSVIKRYFSEVGNYEVKVVPDGYNGLIEVKRSMPGLVLLDIRMPAIDGLSILEKLKADAETAYIPVIVLTGFDDNEVRDKALSMKASAYLVKPISLKALREKMDFWLETILGD